MIKDTQKPQPNDTNYLNFMYLTLIMTCGTKTLVNANLLFSQKEIHL